MLSQTHLFALLGGLLLLAFASNRLFHRSGVPDLVVLMLAGLLIGPVLHAANGGQFQTFTQYLGTLALILILFEGGAELQLRRTLHYFPSGILLALWGYGLSFFATAVAARMAMHLTTSSSILVRAVLGCTSGTMVLPALQQIEPGEHVRVVLLIEAALGDVIAVITVGSLVDLAEGDPLLSGLATAFVLRALISILAAALVGFFWTRIRPRLAHLRFNNIATLGVVLSLYAASRLLGGSGLLAVLVFGLALANITAAEKIEAKPQLLAFHSELSFLVRSFFFVLLGMQVQPISRNLWAAIGAVVLGLLVARILAVQVVRIPGLRPTDRELIFWMLPRGLVTAVLALKVFQTKGPQFAFLPDMAFAVVLVTNVFLLIGSVRARKRARVLDSPSAHPIAN